MSLELPESVDATILPERRSPPRQPYPGLRPFDENEQRLFFGRDHQIKEILKRLQQTHFAVVIGGSGSGKSSIVNAGVIPALRKKQLRASGDFWLTACFSPKDQPLRHLATALAAFVEPRPDQSTDQMVEDVEQTLLETNSLAGFLKRYRSRLRLEEGQAPESRESANLLIVCDQFEEIFREQNRNNPQTRQLVDLIVEAHRNRDDYPQLYVIIGMRSEDLHHCAQYIDLPNVVNDASFLTRRLDENEIASAIIEPIRLVLRLRGIKPKRYEPIEVDPWPFDPDLLRRLNLAVSSLAFNPDHLPLLQHLLSVLWRYVETNKPILRDAATTDAAAAFRITADDLAAALGFSKIAEADELARRRKLPNSWILERALDGAAEGVMPADNRLKRIAEMMFRLLALVNDRGIYTRRWTTRAEIAGLTRDLTIHKANGVAELLRRLAQHLRGRRAEPDARPATDDEIEAVISAFRSTYPFLYVREGRDGKIDVSHEAFIRNWSTFRTWLNDERTLALAFEALRTAYQRWREKLRDPHRWWLGRLSAICGDRLSGEKLQQMRDWWNRRRYNAAWAARWADGVESQDADAEQREPWQINDEMLRSLRRYYWRSLWLRRVTRAGPAILVLALLFFAGWAFDSAHKANNSKIQLEAWRPFSAAEATSSRITKRQSNQESDEPGAKALIFESAVEMEYVRHIRKRKAENAGLVEHGGSIEKAKAWLLKQYHKMRPLEDFGLVEFASAQIDKTAREVMSSAVWPVSMSLPQGHTLSGRTERKSDEPICPDRTNEYLKQQSGGVDPEIVVARHTLAPFEPSGGKLLSMVQLSETNLNFSLVSPRCDAPVQWMYTLGIAPNTDVKVDADLSLIVVNSKTEPKTWLYRFDWVRLCRQDELPKNQVSQTCVVDFVPIVTWTVHSNGPYEVVDSSRVRAGGIEYQLRRDYGPRPLNAMEAEVAREELGGGKSPVDRSRDKIPGCDELSGYGAVLAAEKVAGKYDTLRIFGVTADRRCEDYPVRAKEIMRFDLGSYSIRRVAFARKLSPIKDVPDFIYLQSQEQDVIYKLVWNPTAVRSLLCDTLRNQNDGGVPLPDALPISIDVKAMLSNDAGINDLSAEICKIESDDLATK